MADDYWVLVHAATRAQRRADMYARQPQDGWKAWTWLLDEAMTFATEQAALSYRDTHFQPGEVLQLCIARFPVAA